MSFKVISTGPKPSSKTEVASVLPALVLEPQDPLIVYPLLARITL